MRHQLKIIDEIITIDDFKLALLDILKTLADTNLSESMLVPSLTQAFYKHYHRPIRSVLRQVAPGIKLGELLNQLLGKLSLK